MVSGCRSSHGGRQPRSVDKASGRMSNHRPSLKATYSEECEPEYDVVDVFRNHCSAACRRSSNRACWSCARESQIHAIYNRDAGAAGLHTPKSALKHVIRRSTFKKWAKSYYGSVRDNVASEIANAYYAKHHSEPAFKAFSCVLKNRMIKKAKQEAEVFALRIIMSRWHAFAIHASAERDHVLSASLFYQSSLFSRALKALKMEVRRTKKSRHYISLMVNIIERSLLNRIINPLREHAAQARRMEEFKKNIEQIRRTNAKIVTLDTLNFTYRCRVAAEKLEAIIQLSLFRQAWNHFVSENRQLYEKEILVEKALSREKVANALNCWNEAVKQRHASQYYEFFLKYRSFSALKRAHQHCSTGYSSSPTSTASDHTVTAGTGVASNIKAAVTQKRKIISGVGILSRLAQQWCKRLAIRMLRENVEIVTAALLKQDKIWQDYVSLRQKRRHMKQIRDESYRRSLLSRAFAAIRKTYLEKLENFDAELANFKIKQRLLHLRGYFIAFVSAVDRSRALRIARGVIESLHESKTRSAVMEALEGLTAKTLLCKMNCIARLCNITVTWDEENASSILVEFRNMVFRSRNDEQGTFRPFLELPLSDNIMATVTMPLRSECIILLYFISGLKTRALELMQEFGMRPDDLCVRVCESLGMKELNELKSRYAYQLYKVRLEGYPAISVAPQMVNSSHEGVLALPNNDTVTDKLPGSLPSSTSSETSNAASAKSIRGQDKEDRTANGSSLTNLGIIGYSNDIPNWLPSLLRQLTISKVCNQGKASDGRIEEVHVPHVAVDLLCSGMPLWRLCFTKLTMARCVSAFRSWKAYSMEKRERRRRMSELGTSLEGLFNMSILMKWFKVWLEVKQIESSRRVAECAERCTLFTSMLSNLVYSSVSIVLIRLHLRCVMSNPAASDRAQQIRRLFKSVVVSCRSSDALAEISEFRMYDLVRKQFIEWRSFTQWNLEVKSKASSFYRHMFLKQGWDAVYAAFLDRKQRREELESHLDSGMRHWYLQYTFDTWSKATLCLRAVRSINPPSHVMLRACLQHWKFHARNSTRLADIHILINKSLDGSILTHAWNTLVDHASKASSLKLLSERFHEIDVKICMREALEHWKFVKTTIKTLEYAHLEIHKSAESALQKHVLMTMRNFTLLKRAAERRIKSTVLGTMEILSASAKIERILDIRLDQWEKDSRREFFTLQREMKRDEAKYREFLNEKNVVYSALLALSKLEETRTSAGIQALRNNLLYKATIKRLTEVRENKLMYAFFRSWKQWATYNARTSHKEKDIVNTDQATASDQMIPYHGEMPMVTYHAPSEDEIDRYCLVMSCFKQWRNTTIMLPGRNAAEMIEEFATCNRQLDGIYALKLYALSALWARTCETRLRLLVDSMECKLKWSIFHKWKNLSRDRMLELYDENSFTA